VSTWVPIIHAITRHHPYRHQVRTEGQKDFGQKNGDWIQRADQNSPLSNAILPLHQIAPIKKIIFLPQIFLPTRLAWTATIPRRRFSTPPTTRIRANL
jgi:hypothetical protein